MPILSTASNQFSNLDPSQVPAVLDNTISDLVDQINGAPQIYAVNSQDKQPTGLKDGDLLVGLNASNQPQVSVNNGANSLPISSTQTQVDMGFGGIISATGLPSTSHFNTNTWGFYTDTSSGFNYIAYNQGGTVFKQQLT